MGPRPAPGRRPRHRHCAHSEFPACPMPRVWIPAEERATTRHNAVTLPALGGRPTYALREACDPAPNALAAPIARVIALTALAALGVSGDPVHESVHAKATPSASC